MRLIAILILTATVASAQTVTLDTVSVTVGTPSTVNATVTPGVDGITGWSFGVAHDATLTMDSVVSPLVLSVDADYLSTDIQVGGYTHAAVISLSIPATVFPGGVVATSTYTGFGAVAFTSMTLGTPPVENVVVGLAGVELLATWIDGGVSEVQLLFQRADCNGSATVSITDAIFTLEALFMAGAAQPGCPDACDANDDGFMDISDVLYSLGYLFDGGIAPPAPFGVCGADVTVDALGCAVSIACP